MVQFFKGDEDEVKIYNSGKVILNALSLQLSEFYDECYNSGPLGDVIFKDLRSPLANAIPLNIYRRTFNELFNQFEVFGTFESYINVFKKVFGEEVIVDFTVPGPGLLNIEITATGFEISDFVSREIEDEEYVLYDMEDHEGNQLIFNTVLGFQTEYELMQMLFEMVPAGVHTSITLQIGSEE